MKDNLEFYCKILKNYHFYYSPPVDVIVGGVGIFVKDTFVVTSSRRRYDVVTTSSYVVVTTTSSSSCSRPTSSYVVLTSSLRRRDDVVVRRRRVVRKFGSIAWSEGAAPLGIERRLTHKTVALYWVCRYRLPSAVVDYQIQYYTFTI